MVRICCVKGCRSESYQGCGISFHSFPRNENIKAQWMEVIRRAGEITCRNPVVCSRHFRREDYKPTLLPRLKDGAIPSLAITPQSKKIKVLSNILLPNLELTPCLSTSQGTGKENITEHVLIEKTVQPAIKRRRIGDAVETGVQTAAYTSAKEETLERKVKALSQKLYRRDAKIESLQSLLATIKNKCKNYEEVKHVVTDNFSNIHKHFNYEKSNTGIRYTDELKQFALTLYYYSGPAYRLLRNHIALPHPATLRKILSTIDCNVGFMKEAFEFLKNERKKNEDLSDVALIFDAMSIKSEKVFDKHSGKYVGYVDFGGILQPEAEAYATEVLVFQIVSYNKKIKCPVGYFLINKTTAHVQAQLIITAIRMLSEVNITVRSLTCDGTSVNKTCYEVLGCNFTSPEMKTSFKHPVKEVKIYCIFDPPHMMKLARNVFAEASITSETGSVNFSFVKDLHNLQKEEGLRLANKLCDAHVNFFQKKMNVKLATQLLSSSVADAIEFLSKSGHPKFIGSEATIEYIRVLDRLFDVMNAKDPRGTGFKSPLRLENKDIWTNVLEESRQYLTSLKVNDEPILNHRRKMPALGFVINTYSFQNLALDLLLQDKNVFKYFLPYKCSQDHLEMFFSCIRARGGANDNPNALEFKYIMRKLLFHNSVKPSVNANCTDAEVAFQLSPIVEFRTKKRSMTRESTINETEEKQIKCLLQHVENVTVSEYKLNVMYYITGYIVNKLTKKITCNHCHDALLTNKERKDHTYTVDLHEFSAFTTFIDRGGLKFVAKFPFEVVKYAEKLFTLSVSSDSSNTMTRSKLMMLTLQHFIPNIHSFFNPRHPLQPMETEDSHELQLVKALATDYFNLRMAHHGKTDSLRILGRKVGLRQKLRKTILFSNV